MVSLYLRSSIFDSLPTSTRLTLNMLFFWLGPPRAEFTSTYSHEGLSLTYFTATCDTKDFIATVKQTTGDSDLIISVPIKREWRPEWMCIVWRGNSHAKDQCFSFVVWRKPFPSEARGGGGVANRSSFPVSTVYKENIHRFFLPLPKAGPLQRLLLLRAANPVPCSVVYTNPASLYVCV